MSTVAVLGAGNGGLAAACDLTTRGHSVRLYNRSTPVIEAVKERGGIRLTGVSGEETIAIQEATTDIAGAVAGADTIMVVLPATAHAEIADSLADNADPAVPVILNPGHMCGSLHFRKVFAKRAMTPPPVAELGTLTYVCRSQDAGAVDIYLRASEVPVAIVPQGDERAGAAVRDLYPDVAKAHPIATWLHDVNMVLHPPGMILGASWIEATSGGFRFYSEGVTPAVARVMESLDRERLEVGRAYGFELPGLADTMAALGTADPAAALAGDLRSAVADGTANRSIEAPPSMGHRYIYEDIPYGLVPFTAVAAAAGVATPVADALIQLAGTIVGRDFRVEGLNADRLGIGGLDAHGLKEAVTG